MPAAKPENESSDLAQRTKPRRQRVYTSETFGLILIALVLLVITLVRYWNEIHWSLR